MSDRPPPIAIWRFGDASRMRPCICVPVERKRRDLYMAELPEQWARAHADFEFLPVLCEAGPERQ